MDEPCPGCGGLFAPEEGPTHDYMLSSPSCWGLYGQVLIREYEDMALWRSSHRLTVDAYAVQHPGAAGDRRAEQSVWIHFTSLHLIFAHNASQDEATASLQRLVRQDFPSLGASPTHFEMTVLDVFEAGRDQHGESVLSWAHAAYEGRPDLIDGAEMLIGQHLGKVQ